MGYFDKSSEDGNSKFELLISATTGSAMAMLIIGKMVQAHGYTFGTIAPSVLLLFCLWWPFLYRKSNLGDS